MEMPGIDVFTRLETRKVGQMLKAIARIDPVVRLMDVPA